MLYREADRAFAIGDRLQLTAPDRDHHLANRELGTVEQLQPKDQMRLHLDSGRTVDLNLRAHPHLDMYLSPNSAHPLKTMGCSVCHEGSGQETDFVLAYATTRTTADNGQLLPMIELTMTKAARTTQKKRPPRA